MNLPRDILARFYGWNRDAHLYLGLFLSPFLLVFALSVLFLNHVWVPGMASEKIVRPAARVAVPPGFEQAEGMERAQLAHRILGELGISGEIGYIARRDEDLHFVIPVNRPGWQAVVDLDPQAGTATVEEQSTGLADAINYLHKSPGPHNANIRGNWLWTRIWKLAADGIVYLLLLISISGIYLWVSLKAERKAGLALLAAGAVCFTALVFSLSP
jgi:hypothetical protein